MQSCQKEPVNAKARMAAAVRPTERAHSLPVLSLRTSRAVMSEDAMVQHEMMIEIALWAATGAPRSRCMTGQAVPNKESGRPSEIKVR